MTTITKIPTWLKLDTGAHNDTCGVCLEECLSLLLDQDKTDRPDRVHPIIRDLAIAANDAESDPKKRRLLARTLACQVDTDDVSDEITNRLAVFVCRYSADQLPDDTDERVGAALISAAACLEDPTDETRKRAARDAADAARAAADAARAAADAADAAADAARAAADAAAWAARDAAWAARAAAWAARAALYADLLTATIAEFDRLTGRTECHKFTKADWDRVRAALEESTERKS